MAAVAVRVMPTGTSTESPILTEWEASLLETARDRRIVRKHIQTLRQFAQFCRVPLERVTPQHVVPFARTMERSGLKASEYNGAIFSLQLFFVWRDRPAGRTVPNLHHLIGVRTSKRSVHLPPIVLEWLTDLEGENRSCHTCLAYSSAIALFGRFNKGRGIKGATGADLVRYARTRPRVCATVTLR